MPTISEKQKGRKLFNARMKLIRRYVDFDYDLRNPPTEYQKRRVKEYADEIQALMNRPYQVFRPRRRDHLIAAQEFAQHEKRLPGLKVAFIPSDGTHDVHVRFNSKGEIVAKTSNVKITTVRLSKRKLIEDAESHVRDKIRNHPAKQFTIQAGRYEIPNPYLPDTVPKAVARLVARYGDDDKNNYFGNWLHGLKAYQFAGQDALGDYLADKRKVIKDAKKKRASAARKRRRIEAKRDMGR